MRAELTVAEPIEKILDDWDFFADEIVGKFTSFRTVGQNIYGIRRRAITRTEIVDPRKGAFGTFFELGPKGAVTCKFEPMRLHLTTAGTPHRVPHSMGFWHINDMDELYLPLPGAASDPLGHFLVIMQTPTGREGESFAFYCERCCTLLHELRYQTGEHGLQGMHRAEERAVREFNAELGRRTCPDCGTVNPLGYCWNTAKDTPDERDARAIW
jgi:hypothetical protein